MHTEVIRTRIQMNIFPEQEWRCRHRQGMCVHRREGEGGMNRGAQTYMCHMCELDGQREAATDTQHRALSSVLGDDLERQNCVGRLKRDAMYLHEELILLVVRQKLTQHSKVIIVQ